MKNEKTIKIIIEKTKRKVIGPNNIIKALYPSIPLNDEPKFFQWTSIINLKKFGLEDDFATGINYFDEKVAQLKALGEGIERFYLAAYSPENFIYNSFTELINKGVKAVNPQLFISFKSSKRKISIADSHSKIYWTKGKTFLSNKTILLPAQLIFVPYREVEPLIMPSISTGAAAHTSRKTAMLKGILEIIERDAFVIYWLNKLPPLSIDIQNLKSKTIQTLKEIFERYYLEWFVFILRTDTPTWNIMSLLIDESNEGPFISVGLSSDLNLIEAIIHSAEEAYMSRIFARYSILENKKRKMKKINPNKISTHEERALFWYRKRKKLEKSIGFIFEGKKLKVDKTYLKRMTTKEKYNTILEYVKKEKIPLFYVNLAKINIDKQLKWYVKKIITYYYCPLYLDEEFKPLLHPRIYRIPKILGFEEKNINQLNKLPHPFL